MDPQVQLHNLRAGYAHLLTRVNTALRAYVGDPERLAEVRTMAMSLRSASQQVRYHEIRSSCSF